MCGRTPREKELESKPVDTLNNSFALLFTYPVPAPKLVVTVEVTSHDNLVRWVSSLCLFHLAQYSVYVPSSTTNICNWGYIYREYEEGSVLYLDLDCGDIAGQNFDLAGSQ